MTNPQHPSVAVIVINQNGKHHLEDCFTSLLEFTPSWVKLVLLDNGSTDGSVDYVRTNFSRVEIIAHSENKGFAGAYDEAIRQRKEEYSVLLNNDTKVTKGWLEPLLGAASPSDVAIVGSRLVGYPDTTVVDHAGGLISIGGGGVDLDKGRKLGPKSQGARPTGFACGACMLVRNQTFADLGGFCSDYVIYHEDVDLAWKAWLAGFKVIHAPQSIVLHKGGATMGDIESPRRLYLAQRNRAFNLLQNAGAGLLLIGAITSLAFDFFRISKWLIAGRLNLVGILFKANASILLRLPQSLRKRKIVQHKLRKRSDLELLRGGIFCGPIRSLRAFRVR